MNDRDEAFDLFLREALAPRDRGEDVLFAARVQALVALEEHMAANRRAMMRRLGRELVALLAFGAAVVAVTTAPSLAEAIAAQRPMVLAALILGFGMLVFLLSTSDSQSPTEPARP